MYGITCLSPFTLVHVSAHVAIFHLVNVGKYTMTMDPMGC